MAGILVVGYVFVDIKGFASGNYVPEGRNLGDVRMVHGGVSRNVVENIANTGMSVTFASLCEDSAFGLAVRKRLCEAGVSVDAMREVKENGIGKWMVILDEKGNVAGQISCPPDQSLLDEWVMEHGEEWVQVADSIILELDTSPKMDEHILSLAKRYGKPVYTVVGNMSVILARPDFVSALDCFVCNEIEAGRLFSVDTSRMLPREMLALLQHHISSLGCPSAVITMGESGSVYVDSRTGEYGICPAIPTHLIDSTGAGDAFLSGVVMGLGRGMSLGAAVQAGTCLASRAIATDESAVPKDHAFWN